MARRWRDDPMVRARWVLLAVAAAAVGLTWLVTEDITARFTAGMAAGLGMIVWGASERIIVSTRSRPETRLADARQGRAIDR